MLKKGEKMETLEFGPKYAYSDIKIAACMDAFGSC
jgi:hypothetical protein